jgi:hypothetical protein
LLTNNNEKIEPTADEFYFLLKILKPEILSGKSSYAYLFYIELYGIYSRFIKYNYVSFAEFLKLFTKGGV